VNRFGILVASLASLPLLSSAGVAQTLAEWPEQSFIAAGTRYTLSDASRTCLTPLELQTTAAVREPACEVEAFRLIGSREASRMYAVQYRRSALVEWTEPADSVEWDELVLFRSVSEGDSLVAVWRIRTERAIEFVSGMKAHPRQGILLVEVLLCLNGTGGCSRNYLVDSAAGLEHVSMPFAEALRTQLPEGERLHKGMTLDMETLRGTWPVAGPGDANCCPSKVFDHAVRLDRTELILVRCAAIRWGIAAQVSVWRRQRRPTLRVEDPPHSVLPTEPDIV
jgi:hypothetical protein